VLWTGLVWPRIGTGGESSCEFGNEPLGSIKMRLICHHGYDY
jgi:hypothetical protein